MFVSVGSSVVQVQEQKQQDLLLDQSIRCSLSNEPANKLRMACWCGPPDNWGGKASTSLIPFKMSLFAAFHSGFQTIMGSAVKQGVFSTSLEIQPAQANASAGSFMVEHSV